MLIPFVRNVTAGQELLWQSIKIRKSLDEICHTLELAVPPSEFLKVRKHHRLEVRCRNKLINGKNREPLVTTILVDEITACVDQKKHTVTVIGRSPARDIIDSSWTDLDDQKIIPPFVYRDKTLREITKYIASKFNITCDTFPTDQPDPTKKVLSFYFEKESPWTKLIDEADQQGYIFTSNEAGNLYLWEVASLVRQEGFNITERINVKSIKWTENGSEQFKNYIVSGNYKSFITVDNTCLGNRTLSIGVDEFSPDEEKIRRRAETEKRRRSETKINVTVPGWGLTDEQFKRLGNTDEKEIYWSPNFLIPVKMPLLGLNNVELLISEVEYSATPESMSCDITLVKRDMYL